MNLHLRSSTISRCCSIVLAMPGNCIVFQFTEERFPCTIEGLLIHTAMKVTLRLIVCYKEGVHHSVLSIKGSSTVIM